MQPFFPRGQGRILRHGADPKGFAPSRQWCQRTQIEQNTIPRPDGLPVRPLLSLAGSVHCPRVPCPKPVSRKRGFAAWLSGMPFLRLCWRESGCRIACCATSCVSRGQWPYPARAHWTLGVKRGIHHGLVRLQQRSHARCLYCGRAGRLRSVGPHPEGGHQPAFRIAISYDRCCDCFWIPHPPDCR